MAGARVLTPFRRTIRHGVVSLASGLDGWLLDRTVRQRSVRVNKVDVRSRPCLGDFETEVYWIDRPTSGEVGPGVSVFLGRQELLRVDLFAERPHVHYGLDLCRLRPAPTARVFLPSPLGDRATRGRHEVRHNLAYCVRQHPRRGVRELEFPDHELEELADWVGTQISDLEQIHGGAPDHERRDGASAG